MLWQNSDRALIFNNLNKHYHLKWNCSGQSWAQWTLNLKLESWLWFSTSVPWHIGVLQMIHRSAAGVWGEGYLVGPLGDVSLLPAAWCALSSIKQLMVCLDDFSSVRLKSVSGVGCCSEGRLRLAQVISKVRGNPTKSTLQCSLPDAQPCSTGDR